MTVFLPLLGKSRNRCEPHTHRLTILERRELEKRKKEARVEEYIRLMEQYELSKSELAKRLGVSRAWVTTVLKVRNGNP